MGMFKKKVKISNSKNPKQFFEEEFWVDTGVLFSCSERRPGKFWSRCGSDSKKVETDFGNYRWFLSIAMTIANLVTFFCLTMQPDTYN